MIKVSASNIDRVQACPGSHAAEQGLPRTQSDVAEEGNLLHDVMAMVKPATGLTSSQSRYINYCSEKAKELIADCLDNTAKDFEFVREWYGQARLLDGIVAAKLDFTAWSDTRALVIDWKFGHNPVDRAELNLQLRPYAIIAAQERPVVESTVVAIVQPTVAPEDRVTVAQYTRDDIRAAKDELNAIVLEATKPDAPRYPGDHCKYCKALGTVRCPESKAVAQQLVPLTKADVMPVGEELARFVEAWKILEPMGAQLMEHAREQLQADPASIPGYYLSDDIPIRKLNDVETAWAAAETAGVTPQEFMAACGVSVTELQDRLREKFGWRAKDAKSEFNKLMAAAITMETKRGSVKRTP